MTPYWYPYMYLPTLGPGLPDGSPPQPVEERYVVYGYADDVKPSVTTMAECGVVDNAAGLFERSSGCKLHRDPVTIQSEHLLPKQILVQNC